MNLSRKTLAVLVTTAGVVTAGGLTGGYALAAANTPRVPAAMYSCENSTRTLKTALTEHPQTCPVGMSEVKLLTAGGNAPQGPAGPQGPQGPKGDTGAKGDTGPSGVVSTSVNDLGGIASVPTGGGFVANSTEVGTGINLSAGTYLITVTAKATPNMTSAVNVFPQFFIYNQVKNSSFTGDLLNVGSGALESGGNTNIDSYYSGMTTITLNAATTLHVYAFGYDSDRGAGTYVLDDLTVTVTKVTPAA